MPSDIAPSVHGDELPRGGSNITMVVDVEHVEKMLHRGTRQRFEVFCDDDTFLCQDNSLSADNACSLGGTGRVWSEEIDTADQASCVTTAAECGRKRKLKTQDWESVNLALSTATW